MLAYQVYRGNPFHLRMSLHQLVSRLPPEEVILIGDESNQGNGPWVHVLADFESPTVDRMRRAYVHMSTNPDWFELLCLQRWVLILDHLESVGYEGPVLHLDSDTLVHTDFVLNASELPDLANVAITGPQFSLFRNKCVLREFVDFILAQYENPRDLQHLKEFYRTKVSDLPWHGGNVCDMHMMGLFARQLGSGFRDINDLGLGGFFEKHIGELEGFEMDRDLRLKKVLVPADQNVPYLLRGRDGVPLLGQHFVGWAKALMPRYYRGSEPVMLTNQERQTTAEAIARRRRSAKVEALKDLLRPIKRRLLG